YGDPGNGKSFFSKIYAKSMNAEYKEINATDFQKRYIGESLEGLENVFEDSLQIAKQNPDKEYVLVLNEADQLIFSADKLKETSGGYGFFRLDMRDIFINYLDRLKEEAPNVTFIGTVNFTPTDGALDRAILSRFGKNIIEVTYPDANTLYEASKAKLKNLANYEDWISKNDEKLMELAKDMENRQCSFRNLDNIIDIAKETNLKNRMQDRSKQFDIQYMFDALGKIEHTDGEISAAQKINTKR
ncbi:MAG: ATP-binding protein, partial [bacterium]|nr:ATP-binding protein [bacterium]